MTAVPTSQVVRALVLGVVVIGTVGFMASGRSVTVSIDEASHQVRTYASSVGEVLSDEGVVVGPHDTVVPALTAPVADGTRIEVRRGRPVVVVVDGMSRQIWTTATTVEQLASSLGSRYVTATLTASRSQRIPLAGLSVGFALPKLITVSHDGRRTSMMTTAPTVADALEAAGVSVVGMDKVSPLSNRVVVDGMTISVVRVTQRRVTRRSDIDNKVIVRNTASLYRGQQRVAQHGRDGVRVTTYVVTYHDGKASSRTTVSVRVARHPRARVVLHGTRVRPPSSAYVSQSVDSLNWSALARCESSGHPRSIGGRGRYFGLYQFTLGTWRSVGGQGNPIDASPGEQTYRAKLLYRSRGSSPWPVCGHWLYS